jgi:hypothetical protein
MNKNQIFTLAMLLCVGATTSVFAMQEKDKSDKHKPSYKYELRHVRVELDEKGQATKNETVLDWNGNDPKAKPEELDSMWKRVLRYPKNFLTNGGDYSAFFGGAGVTFIAWLVATNWQSLKTAAGFGSSSCCDDEDDMDDINNEEMDAFEEEAELDEINE